MLYALCSYLMIQISHSLSIPESEVSLAFVRSPGPGGQNVNKVATAVLLRFDIAGSPSLSAPVKQRLIRLGGARVSREGALLIRASRFRTQGQNRQDAVDRFIALVRRALVAPRPRRKTKPKAAAREKRLERKKIRSRNKKLRRTVADWDN
jgi:ribosome-associated protein